MNAPPLVTLLWRDWQPAWSVDAVAALSLVLYLIGTRRVHGRWPKRRTAFFAAGIGCILIAL